MTAPQLRNPAQHHPTSTVRPADFDVFEIGYDSLDNVRIAGWYCVLKHTVLAPPYPGLRIVPGYISEPTMPKAWALRGYATVGVAPRGKLRSNRQYNQGYPGLLIDNIVDRHTYAYRGFYVDAARTVDFLHTRPEVDRARIGVHGSSQGGALTSIARTLELFDPVAHVAAIRSAIMLTAGDDDGELWLRPLRAACESPCDVYRLTHQGAVDHDRLDAWLAGQLGEQPRSRFREHV